MKFKNTFYPSLVYMVTKYSPPKAEDSKVYSKEGGKCMANSRAGMTGTQVNTKPKCSQKCEELTGYKIDL